MILATTDTIAGAEIVETLGMVRGSTVRARHVGSDLMAGLKNLVGGELEGYTKMLAETREQALDRMTHEATTLGADAVVAVRFSTSELMSGAAEIVAYGTAVRLERKS